jgi:hypothetical protein
MALGERGGSRPAPAPAVRPDYSRDNTDENDDFARSLGDTDPASRRVRLLCEFRNPWPCSS